ncbi:hypothetical protein ABI59_11560 [Acidobacteria bacterium Mor1]|nr:hypothetical protein ABI59_11560 [Acidobacteria bacterium Mor1]
MRRSLWVLVVFGITCATTGWADQPEVGAGSEDDLRRQVRAWDLAFTEGKFDDLAPMMADEFILDGATGPQLIALLKQLPSDVREIARDNVSIHRSGDTALVYASVTMRGNWQGRSFTKVYSALDVWVLRGDAWKCLTARSSGSREWYEKSKRRVVKLGPDVVADVVVLFHPDTDPAEIEAFQHDALGRGSDGKTPSYVRSYSLGPVIDGHRSVALQLGELNSFEERELFAAILASPYVFRMFENIAPSAIELAE